MLTKNILTAAVLFVSLLGFPGQVKAAEYAVLLKTLANPFWQTMKQGVEVESKKLGIQVDVFASPSESDVQAQLTLFEDLLNKNYKGIRSRLRPTKREFFWSTWMKRLT
jgi:ABC-type sugar transport system substrate-binding protein